MRDTSSALLINEPNELSLAIDILEIMLELQVAKLYIATILLKLYQTNVQNQGRNVRPCEYIIMNIYYILRTIYL